MAALEEAEAVDAVATEVDQEADRVEVLEELLEEARAEAVLTNPKDQDPLTQITQKTTTMALKNETKSLETKKDQSFQSKRESQTIKKVVSEAEAVEVETAAVEVVAETVEAEAVVGALTAEEGAAVEETVAGEAAVGAQTAEEEAVVVAEAGTRIAQPNHLCLTRRTETSKLSSKTRQKAL